MENDEIARYLASLEREDCYRVDAVLKESVRELTQRVFFVGANGAEQGPYIRKIFQRDSGLGAAYKRIFEAQRNGKRLEHIPMVLECYQHEDLLVVVTEFVDGETLHDRVYRCDSSAQLAHDVFPQLCDAVTELHESFDPPLIHRDLKPSNVMLTAGGLMLIDFGIAREFKEGAEADTTHFGTRAFAPPEQFGFGQTTVRSDVYALGMTLYYCLTEKIPTSQVRDAKFREDGVPPGLRSVLVRATALDPVERYASAGELKAAFLEAGAQVLEGDAIPGRDTARAHHPRDGGRSPAVPAAAIVAACIGAVLLATCIALFAMGAFSRAEDQAADQAAPSFGSAQQATQSSDEKLDDEAGRTEAGEVTEADVTASMQTGAPPRDGFDSATNITATVGGLAFQIPSYFGIPMSQDGNDATYYYAEAGTTLVMLMTQEKTVSPNADGDATADDYKSYKDGVLKGMIESDAGLFSEVVSSTDCNLAGRSARIVTLKGAMSDVPITTKAVYFIGPGAEDGLFDTGTVVLAQTDNAQFDYSADFAKTVLSARDGA